MSKHPVLTGLSLVVCLLQLTGCGLADDDNVEFETVLLNIGHEEISHSAEYASVFSSFLGDGSHANVPARFEDQSSAALAALLARRLEHLEHLETLTAASPEAQDSSALHALVFAYRQYAELTSHGHGDITLDQASPYALTHLTGAYLEAPDFLLRHVRIESLSDAQAYLALLSDLPRLLQDDRKQLSADSTLGVTPPLPVIEAAQARLETIMATPIETMPAMVILREGLLGAQTGDAEAEAALLAEAQVLLEGPVREELVALQESLEKISHEAPGTPGIGAQPQGAAWYAAALRQTGASETLTTDALLDGTLERIDALNIRIDRTLRLLERAEDGAAAQVQAVLAEAERAEPPLTVELQLQLEADFVAVQELLRRRLSWMVETPPDTTPQFRFLAASARQAPRWQGLDFDPIDRVVTIDPQDIAATPGLLLPAQLYLTGYPGHALSAGQMSPSLVQLTDRLFGQRGFDDGWALYALDLTEELEAYDNAPSAYLGVLLMQRLEAARAYTDASLHLRGWSVDEAVDFMSGLTGFPPDALRADVLDMAARPARATAGFIGYQRLREMRRRAEDALGEAFSLPEFHAIVLGAGSRPLDVVSADIDRWIAAMGDNAAPQTSG